MSEPRTPPPKPTRTDGGISGQLAYIASLRAAHDADMRAMTRHITSLRAELVGLRAMNETLTTEVNFHRTSKAALLAAARYALEYMSPTGHVQDKLRASITAAEELAP